ncbi:MAG: phosphatidate cytidylyltransferase [Paludibacteraceae bacterium]|nr:phosphatidate cytidylyltransferase [Paludibacteraceae bacterium]
MSISNLITRTCTGAVFVAVILAGIYFQSPWHSLSLVAGLAAFVGLLEFYRMGNLHQDIQLPACAMAVLGMFPYLACVLHACLQQDWIWVVYPVVAIGIYIAVLYDKGPHPIHNLGFILMGQLLVALPLGMLNFLAERHDIIWTYALFVLIWVNDTGAYLVGTLLGKHRLFERVSPKKSWEGSLGGLVFTWIGALLFWYLTGEQQNCWQWFVLASLIVVFGTYGDLLESLLKRSVGVKDSGNILPGHGGVLDRFDSILVATPVVLCYLEIIRML